MTSHKTGTPAEWLAARLELLEAEKELTRRGDELARRRQELPWVRVGKDYRFETSAGTASLADLFAGRSQLLVYHFMFGPDYTAGCRPARRSPTASTASPSTSPATTSRYVRRRGPRWRTYRPTSGGWAGASPGRQPPASTSTSTSRPRPPPSSSGRARASTTSAPWTCGRRWRPATRGRLPSGRPPAAQDPPPGGAFAAGTTTSRVWHEYVEAGHCTTRATAREKLTACGERCGHRMTRNRGDVRVLLSASAFNRVQSQVKEG